MEEEEKIYAGGYVVDTNIFRSLYNYIYQDVFPEIWEGIDDLIARNKFCSVSEVKKECDAQLRHLPEFIMWEKDHAHLFLKPGTDDIEMLRNIYKIPQLRMKPKDILNKKAHADGFLVAKARVLNGCVVTNESPLSKDPAKIPNICEHFKVDCITLHDFLRILRYKEYNVQQ